MKIGILGTGDVGKALGRGFLALGHEVMMGSRSANSPKATEWARQSGTEAHAGTFTQAVDFGEVVVLATLGTVTEDAIRLAGTERFKGKLVLDTTNPLEFSEKGPRLLGGVGDSAGEKHQRLIPHALVVKVFNTVGNALMFQPRFSGGRPDMFLCGNDEGAKSRAAQICHDFGWGTVDVGTIEASHYLEAMCLVWVMTGLKTNQWNQAFKLLRG